MTALDFLEAPATQKRRKAEDFLEEGGGLSEPSPGAFQDKTSDTYPVESSQSAQPRYVPPELLQAEEQAAIERGGGFQVPPWLKQVVPQALKFPGKVALAAGAMQTGRLHWPTDEEVSAPAISPEQMKVAMPYVYVAERARQMFPESKTAQVAAGVTGGMTDAASSFTSAENLATLPFAPAGKLAQRAIAGTFLGQAISGTPEQWEAFNNAPDLTDKIRIATSMGLGYALPALGAAATLRKSPAQVDSVTPARVQSESPKIVEPVRTTQETAKDIALPTEVPRVDTSEVRPNISEVADPSAIPAIDASVRSGTLEKSFVEPIPARPSEASPKTETFRNDPEEYAEALIGDIPKGQPGIAKEFIDGQNAFVFRDEKGSAIGVAKIAKGELTDIAVAKKARRRGIGSQLIKAAISEGGVSYAKGPFTVESAALNKKFGLMERPEPIGVADAIAEIQRRNAPVREETEGQPFGVESQPQTRPRNTISEELRSQSEREGGPSGQQRFRQPIPQTENIPTSTKNASTFAAREKAGFPEPEQVARREFGTVWDEAEAVARADVEAPRRLVAEISENPRALTDKENALLLRRQIEVQNEHAAAIEAVNSAPGDTAALSRLETARNELQTVYDAAKSAGTETGRGLNARKMLANQDFSLAKMEAETRAVVNEGKPLSPKQANEVRNLHARIAQAEAKVAAYEAREIFNTELRQARKAGVRPDTFLDQQAQKARERIIARRGKLFADPIGVTQIAHLADEAIIGAAHIARGVRTFGDWSKTMISEFGERIKPYLQALYQKAQSLHSETAKATRGDINATRVTNLQRQIATLEEKIRAGDTRPSEKRRVGYTEEAVRLRQQRDQLKAQLQAIEDARNPQPSPEEKALTGDKSRIRTNIAKIEAKTAAGAFEPAPKNPPRMDKEKAALLFEYQKAREAYRKGLAEAILKKQSPLKKTGRYTAEVLRIPKAVKASFDYSMIFNQGGFALAARPWLMFKPFLKTVKATLSEKEQFRLDRELQDPKYRPNAPLHRQAGLERSDPNNFTTMEEMMQSRLAEKIPWIGRGVKASNRAFSTFLNELRADWFDTLYANNSKRRPLSLEESKIIANLANLGTGRGNAGQFKRHLVGSGSILWAPSLNLSRLQLLLGQPLAYGKGTFRVRRIVAQEYARVAINLALVYQMAKLVLPDADIEWRDPTSTDFLKIKIGDTRIDPLFGLQQWAVFLAREAKALKMFTTKEKEKRPKYGTGGEVAVRMFRTKLSPVPGTTWDVLDEKNVVGQKVNPESATTGLLTPLGVNSIVEVLRDQGLERGTALGLLSFLGLRLSTYGKNDRKEPKSLEEAMAELRQGKIKEFLTGK